MANKLRPEWEDTIDELVSWIVDSPADLRVGLICGPRACGKSRMIPKAVHLLIDDPEHLVVHVSSHHEALFFRSAVRIAPISDTFDVYYASYRQFITVLRDELGRDVQQAPHSESERHLFERRKILPKRVVVILEDDHEVTAEFYHCLSAVLVWSVKATGRRPDPHSVSIILTATNVINPSVENLLHEFAGKFTRDVIPEPFNLPVPGDHLETITPKRIARHEVSLLSWGILTRRLGSHTATS